VKDRVVRDGNLFTGGGITAGIDFALVLAAELVGADAAQLVQLQLEYAPAPPFNAGSPDTAPGAVVDAGPSAGGAIAEAAHGNHRARRRQHSACADPKPYTKPSLEY
jgi:hypothetical protein